MRQLILLRRVNCHRCDNSYYSAELIVTDAATHTSQQSYLLERYMESCWVYSRHAVHRRGHLSSNHHEIITHNLFPARLSYFWKAWRSCAHYAFWTEPLRTAARHKTFLTKKENARVDSSAHIVTWERTYAAVFPRHEIPMRNDSLTWHVAWSARLPQAWVVMSCKPSVGMCS
jgi:hypothetical protein